MISLSRYKKQLEPLIAIIASPFLSVSPNLLTAISFGFSILFFVLLQYHLYFLAFLSLLGTAFDAIDGYVARKTGKESAFGAFLDSSIDRVSDFFIIAGFGYANLVSWKIVVPTLVTSFLVSYLRARAELAALGKIKFDDGIIQRSERIAIIGGALLLFILLQERSLAQTVLAIVFILLVIVNSITLIQRFMSSYKHL